MRNPTRRGADRNKNGTMGLPELLRKPPPSGGGGGGAADAGELCPLQVSFGQCGAQG